MMDHDSWAAVRDRVVSIIRAGSGTPDEKADKILRMVQDQETGKLCRLLGLPRAGVLRVWVGDDGQVGVMPVSSAESISISLGSDPLVPT